MSDVLEVTNVRFWEITRDNIMKARASIVINDQFVIHGIRIIEGPKGLFIAMPSKQRPGGGFKDIVHPISSEFRYRLQQQILEAFAAETGFGE